jgi:hypothetical protein
MQVVLAKSAKRLQFGIIVVLAGVSTMKRISCWVSFQNQLASALAQVRKADWVVPIFDEQQ